MSLNSNLIKSAATSTISTPATSSPVVKPIAPKYLFEGAVAMINLYCVFGVRFVISMKVLFVTAYLSCLRVSSLYRITLYETPSPISFQLNVAVFAPILPTDISNSSDCSFGIE